MRVRPSVFMFDESTVRRTRGPAVGGSNPRLKDLLERPGDRHVGRYIELEELGHGGMGRVMGAYDPHLKREVALKRLEPHLFDEDGVRRLLVEARAMARLSHPNVVTVYDVEVGSDRTPVVVMELVRGRNLAGWLAQSGRSTEAVLRAFRDAGRGLAAAHRVGIVHRDFKPANVLVDQHNRVKVTDFGLAKLGGVGLWRQGPPPSTGANRASDGAARYRDAVVDEHGSLRVLGPAGVDPWQTEPGGILGTPHYFAPEQYCAGAITTATDQYAFSLALWEALCTKPAFDPGSGVGAKLSGPKPWSHPQVSSALGEALRRGLAAAPEQRWPSMDDLLAVLERELTKVAHGRRRSWILGWVGTALASLVATWGWSARTSELCSGGQERLAEIWDANRHAQIDTALRAASPSFGAEAATRATAALDSYGDRWLAGHRAACTAATIRAEQSPADMDLRMACLHYARRRLATVVGVLADADAQTAEHVDEVVDDLPSVESCTDIEALRARLPRSHEVRAVEQILGDVAEAEALERTGHYGSAMATLSRAEERLAAVSYPPAALELALVHGRIFEALGQYDRSEQASRRALQIAVAQRDALGLARACAALGWGVGHVQERSSAGLPYVELALAMGHPDPLVKIAARYTRAILRSDRGDAAGAADELRELHREAAQVLGPTHPRVTNVLDGLALVLRRRGEYDEAQRLHRTVLDLRKQHFGAKHPLIASSHSNLAAVLFSQGQVAAAAVEENSALHLRREILGEEHPDVARSYDRLGSIQSAQGHYKAAEGNYRRALEILEPRLGRTSMKVNAIRNNLATVLSASGRHDEAAAEFRQVLASYVSSLAPDHPRVILVRNNLAGAYFEQGQWPEAEAQLRAVIASAQQSLGPDHPDLVLYRVNLAAALAVTGRLAESELELRETLALALTTLGEDHPDVATCRNDLAAVQLALGRANEALPLAEQAWLRRSRDDIPRQRHAETAFVLARTLMATAHDRKTRLRARNLAHQALAVYDGAGLRSSAAADAVRKWLATGT